MNASDFIKRTLKQYFWKSISLVSGVLSVFVVVPFLSTNKDLYGLYLFCLSFVIYLTYADLGFLGSAQKFIGEEYINGRKKEEARIIGFSLYILLLFLLPFVILMLWFSIYPKVILPDLSNTGIYIAKRFFIILCIGLPIQTILQRASQIIYSVRIKEYIPMRIEVLGNLIKVGSTFLFFSNGRYLIVEFLLTSIILGVTSSLLSLYFAYKTEGINFFHVLSSLKFDKQLFHKLKGLALSSFLLSLGWVLLFELDLFYIGRFSTIKSLAIYGVSFTILNFARNIVNILLNPIGQRINHLIVEKNNEHLKETIKTTLVILFPLSIVFTILFSISSQELIFQWVGVDYKESVRYINILILVAIALPVINICSYYFTSNLMSRELFKVAILMVSIFFLFLVIISFFTKFEVALASSKVISIWSGSLYSWFKMSSNLDLKIKIFNSKLFLFSGFIIIVYFFIVSVDFFGFNSRISVIIKLVVFQLIALALVFKLQIRNNKSSIIFLKK